MSYQQSSFPNIPLRARSSWRQYGWGNSAQITANQQGIVTPEQQNMLDTGPGCLYSLVFGVFVLGIPTTCLLIGTAIYLVFAGKIAEIRAYTFGELLLCVLLLVVFGKLSSALRRAHQTRFMRVIEALVVSQAQGEIIWENGRYSVRVPGLRLTKTARSPALPPPGPYHFYYVAGQNILLSAQPIHTYTQAFALPGTLAATGLRGDEQARLALQMALCSTLGFSLSDLEANRLGMLTDAQRRKLSIRVFWGIVGSFIGLLVSGGLILLAVISLLNGWIKFGLETNVPIYLLVIGCLMLLLLAIFLWCLNRVTIGARKRYTEIQHAQVQNITGNLQARDEGSDDSESSTLYYYDIGQLSFQVTGAAYNALLSGLLYRVYYLASSKTLVSVEALEAPIR